MRNCWLVLLLLLIVSCKSIKTVEVPIETVKTEYICDIKYDSIYIYDSIDRYRVQDTLIIYKYRDIYKYKYRTDTIMIKDSIEVPITITEETVKEVNKIKWYQNVLMYFGCGFIGVILYVVYKLIRKMC